MPWFDEFEAAAFNYTPLVLVVGAPLRGDLVGGVRKEQVHRPITLFEEDEVTRD